MMQPKDYFVATSNFSRLEVAQICDLQKIVHYSIMYII